MEDTDMLRGRRVIVPGGTGSVGEGVVRAYLAGGADVVVPTRSRSRAEEFRQVLGAAATERLHLVVHDYTTFAGAEALATETVRRLGGIDDVVAPIGGWWAGRSLWQIDEADWQAAFVGLASVHMAVARAVVPRLAGDGTYQLVIGDSATVPVPGSGLVSMEQAALLMMQRVLAAEVTGSQRILALVLGPVRSRTTVGEDAWVTADQVGAVAVAASLGAESGGQLHLGDRAEADTVLGSLAR